MQDPVWLEDTGFPAAARTRRARHLPAAFLAQGRTQSRGPGEPRLLPACPALKARGGGRIRGSARTPRGVVPSPASPPSRRLLRRHVLSSVGSLKGLGEALSKCPVSQMVTGVPRVWEEQSSQAGHAHQPLPLPCQSLSRGAAADQPTGPDGWGQGAEPSLPECEERSGLFLEEY